MLDSGITETEKQAYARHRKEWRDWLHKHYDTEREVWLVYYKKHTNKPSVTYRESLEEALCFGWIDGILRRIDDERYAHRFTPRRAKSKWSPTNVQLAKELIERKAMTKAGLIAFEKRVAYDQDAPEIRPSKEFIIPPDMEEAFESNEIARENFLKLTASFKRQYVLWIDSAKRAETRKRRIRESIERLERGQKLGMK